MPSNKDNRFPLFGTSNIDSKFAIDEKGAYQESYGIGDSHLVSKENGGIDDNGDVGKENIVSLYNKDSDMFQVGKAVFVTNSLKKTQRFVFADFDDINKEHILFFDHRRKSPVGYFTRDTSESGAVTHSHAIENGVVVIKEPSISIDDIDAVSETIVSSLSSGNLNFSDQTAFYNDLVRFGLQELTSPLQKFNLIELFDRYVPRSEENLSVIKTAISNLPDDVQPPKLSVFKGLVSDTYNYLEFNGIKIKDINTAYKLHDIFSDKIEFNTKKIEELNKLIGSDTSPQNLKETYARKINLLASIDKITNDTRKFLDKKGYYKRGEEQSMISAEEIVTVGFDTTGSIIVNEDTNVARIKGGEIVANKISKEEHIINSRQSLKLLGRSVFGRDGVKPPTDSSIREASTTLMSTALNLAKQIDDETFKKFNFMASKLLPIGDTIIKAKDSLKNRKEAERAYYQAKNLMTFIEKCTIAIDDKTRNPFVNGLMREDGKRIRQVSNSTHKIDNEYKELGLDPKKTNTMLIFANIPTLDVGAKSGVLNFFDKVAPVVAIHKDSQDGSVVGISPRNTIEYWRTDQSKIGRLLNAILDLDETKKNAKEILKNQLNYGAKDYSVLDTVSYEEKQKYLNGTLPIPTTGNGLIAIKNDGSKVSQAIGELLQEMRDIMYPSGNFDFSKIKELKERIRGLSNSDIRNEKNLGRYIESVRRNRKENVVLDNMFYVASSEELNKSLLSMLNGETINSLGIENPLHVKFLESSYAVVEKYTKDMRNLLSSVDAKTLIATAKQFGDNVFMAQNNTLLLSGKNEKYGEYVFVPTPNTSYPNNASVVSGITYDRERGFIGNLEVFSLIKNVGQTKTLKELLEKIDESNEKCSVALMGGSPKNDSHQEDNEKIHQSMENSESVLIEDSGSGRRMTLDTSGILQDSTVKNDVSEQKQVHREIKNDTILQQMNSLTDNSLSDDEIAYIKENSERCEIRKIVPKIIISEIVVDIKEHRSSSANVSMNTTKENNDATKKSEKQKMLL